MFQSPLIFADGPVGLAELDQGIPQLGVGVGVLRAEPRGQAQLLGGGGELALPHEDLAQAVAARRRRGS